jgi:hypothetical protein
MRVTKLRRSRGRGKRALFVLSRSLMNERNALQKMPLTDALVGAVAGATGSWAMVCFQHTLGRFIDPPDEEEGTHQHRRRDARPNDTDATIPDEPASNQAASAAAEPVIGRPLTEDEKSVGGPIVHTLFGAAVGALYGVGVAYQPTLAAAGGAAMGTAVWIGASEIGVPLVGLSDRPDRYPASRHAAAFASHLVYGLTVETIRRLLLGPPRRSE